MDKEQMEIRADRFINNEMEPGERYAFCREMEQDKALKEYVAYRKLLIEGELIAAEQEARKAMEQAFPGHGKLRWKSVAACILILLIAGGGIWGYSYRYGTEDIGNAFSFIPSIERPRGGSGLSGEVSDINDAIIAAYDKGEFESAAGAFQKASPEIAGQLPVYSSLYAAVSFMKTGKPQKATAVLSRLPGSEYEKEREWLLLCSYLQAGMRGKAAETAQKIAEEKGSYADEAQKIAKALKERKWF